MARSPYLLPCLGRIELDQQASGPQAVSVEDSTACIHGSRRHAARRPARICCRSRAIIAGLAKATLAPNPKIDWDAWVARLRQVRDAIERDLPEMFHDFNAAHVAARRLSPPLAGAHREWKTKTGKANFITPNSLDEIPTCRRTTARPAADHAAQQRSVQYDDLWLRRSLPRHSRHAHGRADAPQRHRPAGAAGRRQGHPRHRADDGVDAASAGLRVIAYDIPEGCCGGYYPNAMCWSRYGTMPNARKVPAAKSVPVRVVREGIADETSASSDMFSGSLLSDFASDVARAGEVAGRLAMRQSASSRSRRRC